MSAVRLPIEVQVEDVKYLVHPYGEGLDGEPLGYQVADADFGWLPGTYDSVKTAVAAAGEQLAFEQLQALSREVSSIDGEHRPITMFDVKRVMWL